MVSKLETETETTIKCSSCQDHVHAACVKSLHDENTFRCGPCVVYPSVTKNDEDEVEDNVESLSRDIVLSITETIESVDLTKEPETGKSAENTDIINCQCEHCDFVFTDSNQMKDHSCTSYTCTECGKKFFNNTNLEIHTTISH